MRTMTTWVRTLGRVGRDFRAGRAGRISVEKLPSHHVACRLPLSVYSPSKEVAAARQSSFAQLAGIIAIVVVVVEQNARGVGEQ